MNADWQPTSVVMGGVGAYMKIFKSMLNSAHTNADFVNGGAAFNSLSSRSKDFIKQAFITFLVEARLERDSEKKCANCAL